MSTKNENAHPTVRKPSDRKLDLAREPGNQLMTPFEEMERLFENFFPRGWLRPQQWDWPLLGELAQPFAGRMPRVDVIDRDGEVLIRAELPGVDRKDLEVTVGDDAVTIRASTQHEAQQEQGDYHRCEIARGAFTRTLPLPAGVDPDAAKATFRDGLLELTLPKTAKPNRRKVPVS